jgi:hypothetical protein
VDCIDIQHKIPEELKLSQGFRVVNQACIMYLMRTYPHIDPAVYTETVGHHVRSRRVIETFRTKESDGYN